MRHRSYGRFVHVRGSDGVNLDGMFWDDNPAAAVGFLLCPGAEVEFYGGWLSWLGERLAALDFRVLSMNRRDHGAEFGYHTLAAAAMDHRCGVDILTESGAESVVLVGHSYGTLTASQYVHATDDPRVVGLILHHPHPSLRARHGGEPPARPDADRLEDLVAKAQEQVASGRGDEVFLWPSHLAGGRFLVSTYASFVDKRGPDTGGNLAALLGGCGTRPVLALKPRPDTFVGDEEQAFQRLADERPNIEIVTLAPRGRRPTSNRFGGREFEALGITLDWLARHSFPVPL